jgi:hypothetical protein
MLGGFQERTEVVKKAGTTFFIDEKGEAHGEPSISERVFSPHSDAI